MADLNDLDSFAGRLIVKIDGPLIELDDGTQLLVNGIERDEDGQITGLRCAVPPSNAASN